MNKSLLTIMMSIGYVLVFLLIVYIMNYTHEDIHEKISHYYGYEVTNKEVNIFRDSYVIVDVSNKSVNHKDYMFLQSLNELVGYYIIMIIEILFVMFFIWNLNNRIEK